MSEPESDSAPPAEQLRLRRRIASLLWRGLAVLSLSQGRQWHWGPLLGWGLGLAIHGLVTLLNLRGQGLRDRMAASEVQRLRQRG